MDYLRQYQKNIIYHHKVNYFNRFLNALAPLS